MPRLMRSCSAYAGAHPYVVGGIVAFCLMAGVFAFRGVVFETVDDYNVMMTLAGEKTGQPYFQLTFYNSAFASLIALLAKVAPLAQWYSVVMVAMIYVSLTAVFGSMLRRGRSAGVPALVVGTFLLLLFFALFLYPVQRMQFTTTAALLGAAACALAYSVTPAEASAKGTVRALVVSAVFVVLAAVERKSVGYCAFAFWLSALVRLAVYSRAFGLSSPLRPVLLKLGGLFLGAVLVAVSFYGVDYLIRTFGDNAGYDDYNQWRAEYQDHPHPRYGDSPELYEGVGWSEEVYRLANSLIYIDEAIDEEHLRAIVESPLTRDAQPTLREAVSLGVDLVRTNQTAKADFLVVVALLLCAAGLCALAGMRRGWRACAPVTLGVVLLVLLSCALGLYLCLSGRWMLRLFQTICLPAAVCLAFFAFDAVSLRVSGKSPLPGRIVGAAKHAEAGSGRSGVRELTVAFLTAASAFCCFGVAGYLAVGDVGNLQDRDDFSCAQMAAVERYAIDHPDDVFVHDYSISNYYNSYDPFRTYERPLTNLVISGGSYTYTGAYYRQLAANGLGDFLGGDDLLLPNVFYVSSLEYPGYLQNVSDYLATQFGEVAVRQVDTIAGTVGVFKFSLAVGDSPILSWEQTLPLRSDDTGVL